MGLDIYLKAKRNFCLDGGKSDIYKIFPEMVGCDLLDVTFELGYWRKANQIHNWFVVNVQMNKDDQKTYEVTRDDLVFLMNECNKILGTITIINGKTTFNVELAKNILPTVSGFFFGSTDYDEYYIEDLKSTVRIIEKALLLKDEWTFEYESSW